uniref:Uncharacterized protein n=1 Tax=Timema poppense TaxID=170557 RepID=A0A7R9DBH8_TIMPO|nr:unnamed protein product [Timema poppensis]
MVRQDSVCVVVVRDVLMGGMGEVWRCSSRHRHHHVHHHSSVNVVHLLGNKSTAQLTWLHDHLQTTWCLVADGLTRALSRLTSSDTRWMLMYWVLMSSVALGSSTTATGLLLLGSAPHSFTTSERMLGTIESKTNWESRWADTDGNPPESSMFAIVASLSVSTVYNTTDLYSVPPPFPVQLREGGPTQFIGPNGTLFPVPGNGSYFGPFPGDPFLPPPGFNGSSPFNPSGNVSTGNGPYFPLPPRPFPGFPFPPPPGVFPPINGTLPMLPPGGMFLPPPDNLTDLYDEDDPSIYYPPPYDFFYQRDNSTPVPPGPLVPGIVLPPPPDFFAPLVNSTSTPSTSARYKPRPITTTLPAHILQEVTPATVDLSTTTPNSLKLKVIPVKQQLPEVRPFDVPSDYDELNAILYPSSAPVVSYNLDPVTDIVVRPRPPLPYKPPQKPTYILEYDSYKGQQPDYYYYDGVTQRNKATPAPPKASYYYDEVTQRSKATPAPPKASYYYDEVTQRNKATPAPPKASYYYDDIEVLKIMALYRHLGPK